MNPARDIRSLLQEAMALHQQGRAEHAELMYREVLAIDPREPNAWHLLGVAAWQRGDLEVAEANIRKAIGYHGNAAAYHCNLGAVLQQKGDFAEAITAYDDALRLMPDYEEAKKGLARSCAGYGQTLAAACEWGGAAAAYRRALEISPNDATTLGNLAQTLNNAGEPVEALKFYNIALSLKPHDTTIRYNRGICRLGQTLLAGGWQDLAESREVWLPRLDSRKDVLWLKLPLWDGSNLRDKRILIWGNPGIGDEILYASMIPDLIAQGAHVTLGCAERLVPLFARSFPGITAVPKDGPSSPGSDSDFDFHAPGLWLGRWLRPDLKHFPARKAYLSADARMTSMLRANYAAYGRKKIIGIAWHSKTPGYGEHRRMALHELAAALPHDNVLYIDLQYGDTAAERETARREFPGFLLHHDPMIDQNHDLDGFAAQVAACDMVVTIGNTTAHMAGALGVPGLVLLPFAGLTWCWFRDEAKSAWYPELNLLWKTPDGSWNPALAKIPSMIEQYEVQPRPRLDDEASRKSLGVDLHRRGSDLMGRLKLDEAKTLYRQVLAMEPNNVATLNNLAMIAQHEGDRTAARTLYDRALKSAPDSLVTRYNRSICSLTEGKLQEGWADFAASEPHWRNIQDRRSNLPWMDRPLWDGSPLRGKRILVWGDQGIGDEIVYISMIPDLLERGAQVTIECTDRLVPLVTRSFPEVDIVPRETPPRPGADFHFHAPGLWLARWLRPDMNSFPSRAPFLKADTRKTAQLRQRYETSGRKRIVGLSWFTSSQPWGLRRSLPLPEMLKPLALRDMLIVDLQYADTKNAWAEARQIFPDLEAIHDDDVDQLKDMDGYAAQVAACDFVLTISNTTSHVAGALGVPACILMPDVGLTWYWFESGEACPWYPSLTLMRPNIPNRLERAAAMAGGAITDDTTGS